VVTGKNNAIVSRMDYQLPLVQKLTHVKITTAGIASEQAHINQKTVEYNVVLTQAQHLVQLPI
jgi:hypothetical protein